MNKTILGVVAAVVVLAGVYFVMAGKKGQDASMVQENTSQSSQDGNQDQLEDANRTSNSSLIDLMARGSSRCTYSDANSNGTIFTAGGKAKMEFTTVANGVEMKSHAVMDGTTYYGWVEGQSQGFKMKIDQNASASAGTSPGFDWNKQVNYDCAPWAGDGSAFTVPTNVQFTDMSQFTMPPPTQP